MFMNKLRKASIIASRKGPYTLYRYIVEESEDAVQEEVATVTDKYVVVQVFTYGGFLPCNFQKQSVFTLDKFTRVMLKRNRNLILQCLENLETDTWWLVANNFSIDKSLTKTEKLLKHIFAICIQSEFPKMICNEYYFKK